MSTARIFDFITKTTTEIPASELAPGYIQANVDGVEGSVFVKLSDLKSGPRSYNHDFSEVMPLLQDLHNRIQEVYMVTWEEWIDGFQRDKHPENEIRVWLAMADEYEKAIEGKDLAPAQRCEYFEVVLSVMNNGRDKALQVISLAHINRTEAEEIIAGLPWG